MTRDTTKRILTYGAIFIVLMIVVWYSYIAFRGLVEGPSIVISAPTETSFSSSSVMVIGQATRVNSLTLNGQSIVVDENGNFKEPVLLFPGYNVETIQGQDRFGKVVTIQLPMVYNAESTSH